LAVVAVLPNLLLHYLEVQVAVVRITQPLQVLVHRVKGTLVEQDLTAVLVQLKTQVVVAVQVLLALAELAAVRVLAVQDHQTHLAVRLLLTQVAAVAVLWLELLALAVRVVAVQVAHLQ